MSTSKQFLLGNVKTLHSSSVQPSVSVAGEKIVAVYKDSSNNKLYYKAGTVNTLGIIDWGEHHTVLNDVGTTPSVAINNQGVVVEMHHDSGSPDVLWARVGVYSESDKTVGWKTAYPTGYSGALPSVSMAYINQQNIIVATYVEFASSNTVHLLIGKVDSSLSTISWTYLQTILSGYNPKISINDYRDVIFVSDNHVNANIKIGKLKPDLSDIEWGVGSTELTDDTTGYADVSLSPDGFIAFAYQGKPITNLNSVNKSLNYPTIVKSGTLINGNNGVQSVSLNSSLFGPGLGQKPSIATNGSVVVMVQETPFVENGIDPDQKVLVSSSPVKSIYIDRSTWMAHYSNKKLKELVIPGAHDAGMSETNYCTNMASVHPTSDTITQSLDFYNMLGNGVRYFDVRPGWLKKNSSDTTPETWTGHFSSDFGGVGCLGLKMLNKSTDRVNASKTVFQDVLNFLEYSPTSEVIILKFSHYLLQTQKNNLVDNSKLFDYTSDSSITTFKPLVKQLIQDVVDFFGPGNWLYQKPSNETRRIVDIPLSEITNRKSKVIAVFDFVELSGMNLAAMFPNNSQVLSSVHSYADYYIDQNTHAPVMSGCELTVYDHYSNTNDIEVMASYQAPSDSAHPGQRYLYLQQANHQADLYLLSWTLTQQIADIAAGTPAISKLAQQANCCLGSYIQKLLQENDIPLNFTGTPYYPNIVYVDFCTHFVTDICNFVNKTLYPQN